MKKSIKNLEAKKIQNTKSVKGGENGKGTSESTSQASAKPELL